MRALDLTGKRFGRLLALEKCGHIGKYIAWKCKCDCGNETIVAVNNLQNGSTNSCGCLARELSSVRRKTHGLTNTTLHKTWKNIKTRCYNPNCQKYKNYGGKGICMCNEWLDDFNSFYEWSINNGWKDGLTIDRIDSNGNYEPSNCRWATMREQAQNTSRNHFITHNVERKCIAEWCRELNIRTSTFCQRMKNGLNPFTGERE